MDTTLQKYKSNENRDHPNKSNLIDAELGEFGQLIKSFEVSQERAAHIVDILVQREQWDKG